MSLSDSKGGILTTKEARKADHMMEIQKGTHLREGPSKSGNSHVSKKRSGGSTGKRKKKGGPGSSSLSPASTSKSRRGRRKSVVPASLGKEAATRGVWEDYVEGYDAADEVESKDWNVRFQTCVQSLRLASRHQPLAERAEANLKLLHLGQDFIHAAATYGKVIIGEMNLPREQRTLKPVVIGGRAGSFLLIYIDVSIYLSIFLLCVCWMW